MNPDTIIIKNDTGVGIGTEVFNKKGEVIQGIRTISIFINPDHANIAHVEFTTVKLDVEATPKSSVICCACHRKIDFSHNVRLLEQPGMGLGVYSLLCNDCEKEAKSSLKERVNKLVRRFKQWAKGRDW